MDQSKEKWMGYLPKTHLFGNRIHNDADEIGFSLWGIYRFDLVKNPAQVTCKICLKMVAAAERRQKTQPESSDD
jgi:hypothetical protein